MDKIKPSVELTLDSFLKLPRKAQLLFFDIMSRSVTDKDNPYVMFECIGFNTDGCKSPIEQILMFASDIVCYKRKVFIYFVPQQEICINNKKYYADLYYETEKYEEDDDRKEIKLVIECDGHDYHQKSKAQAAKDYERENNLKLAGYDVLRFTGSQIFNDPYGCANKIIDYILMKEGLC